MKERRKEKGNKKKRQIVKDKIKGRKSKIRTS